MHVHMYECMYMHMYVYMHTRSLLPCHCTHIWYITEQMWLPHCKYEPHSHYDTWANRSNILNVYQNTTYCNIFTHYCQVWARNTHASQMSHLCHI